MAKHKHVMVLEGGDDGASWFYCSCCPAVVGVLPRAEGQDLKLGLVVVAPGLGGFSVAELAALGDVWHAQFRNFVRQKCTDRPKRNRRRNFPATSRF